MTDPRYLHHDPEADHCDLCGEPLDCEGFCGCGEPEELPEEAT